jgi:hypothetical protein
VQTADKLDRGMYTRYREMKLLAQRRDLAPGDNGLAERRAVLDSIRESYDFYDWIGMAGLDGRVQVAAGGLLEGADVSQRPWFRNAQKGIHVGDVHEALLPRQDGEPRRFVDIAFPYKDAQGKTLGVLAAHLSWEWARSIERSVIAPARSTRWSSAATAACCSGPPACRARRSTRPAWARGLVPACGRRAPVGA